MIIDAHTHIFPPEVCRARENFFDGEPDFVLLYEDPAAKLVEDGALIEALDSWGAGSGDAAGPGDAGNTENGAVAFGFPFCDTGKSRLCNDYALDAAKRNPGRIFPFACVNPMMPGALAEAERALSAGALGLGEIATYKAGLGDEVRESLTTLAGLCREAGVPLLLHTNEPVGHNYPGKSRMDTSELYALIKSNPGTKWILAHLGGGLFFYHLLKKEADQVLADVYYDTAAAPYLYKPELYRRFIDIAGAGRLLYGSDYPLLGYGRYARDMEAAGVTEEEKRLITGGNLAGVLGLPTDG